MSKYLVSAGVVWVFMAFVIGVIMLLVPAERQASIQKEGVLLKNPSTYLGEVSPKEVSNVAKTSVQVEGTPTTDSNVASATVEVLKK